MFQLVKLLYVSFERNTRKKKIVIGRRSWIIQDNLWLRVSEMSRETISLSLYYCVGKVKQAFTRIRCLAHNKLPYRLRKLCPNFFEYIGSNLFLSKIIFDFVRVKYRKRILREENLKEWNWRKFLEENFQLNFISIKLFDSLLRLRSNARKHIVQRRLSVQRLISALSLSRTLDLLQGYTLSGEDRHEAFMNLGNHRLDSVDNLANEQSPTSFTTKPIQFWKNHFHRTKGGRDFIVSSETQFGKESYELLGRNICVGKKIPWRIIKYIPGKVSYPSFTE